jgi:hypothetical protein
MGQRHQIFLKVKNPVKNERLFRDKGERTKARKLFGAGKYTVIALHHQWLYGRSAAVNILNMLLYTNQDTIESYTNPFGDDFSDYRSHTSTVNEYIDAVMKLLEVQPNLLHPRGIGFENMIFLNDEDDDIRHHFTRGDNNDGITIIDTISRKYCMMNIYDYDAEGEKHGIYSLPALQPVSARRYMAAYYGETIETCNPYYLEDKTKDEKFLVIEANFEGNKKIDAEIKKQTKGVLTLKELKGIFPKFYEGVTV